MADSELNDRLNIVDTAFGIVAAPALLWAISHWAFHKLVISRLPRARLEAVNDTLTKTRELAQGDEHVGLSELERRRVLLLRDAERAWFDAPFLKRYIPSTYGPILRDCEQLSKDVGRFYQLLLHPPVSDTSPNALTGPQLCTSSPPISSTAFSTSDSPPTTATLSDSDESLSAASCVFPSLASDLIYAEPVEDIELTDRITSETAPQTTRDSVEARGADATGTAGTSAGVPDKTADEIIPLGYTTAVEINTALEGTPTIVEKSQDAIEGQAAENPPVKKRKSKKRVRRHSTDDLREMEFTLASLAASLRSSLGEEDHHSSSPW
ncbi:hypothetical protein BC628DRAFT_1415165 [Trametes gibbosa]|nr:hypothetical protein BC628DRAFT_1415165 [Trametes gibbosa]